MPEEVDPDLVNLLGGKQQEPTPATSKKIINEPQLSLPSTPAPPPPSTLVNDNPVNDIGIRNLLNKFTQSVELIIANQANDREQAESTFSLLDSHIRAALADNIRISPAIIEAWTKCLDIKVNINTNATSALDSITKLLAAAKKNDLIVNLGSTSNIGTNGFDLIKLLTDNQSSASDLGNDDDAD